MKKPALVDNWKRSWRWISMQGMTLAASIQGVWITLPEDLRSTLNSKYVAYVTIFCLVGGVIGRLIKQKPEQC